MKAPAYTVKALDETTWQAFAALVEHNNGIFGGCWCMGFHPKEARQGPATAGLNRDRKLERVRAGTAHAALVFDGQDCVGWCQFGEPDEVPRIKNRAAAEQGEARPPDWRIACCYVGKGHRRQGVHAAGLAGALDLIAGLGGGRVEGYPEDARLGAGGISLPRGTIDVREPGIHQGSQDRQAPLGRHQDGRSLVIDVRGELSRQAKD